MYVCTRDSQKRGITVFESFGMLINLIGILHLIFVITDQRLRYAYDTAPEYKFDQHTRYHQGCARLILSG